MPGFKVDERAEEVETIGSCERDDDIAECGSGLNELSKVAPAVNGMGNRHVDRVSGAPQGNDVAESKQDDSGAISHLGTLRAITERANSDDEENGDIQLENDIKDDPTGTVKVHERKGVATRVLSGRLDQLQSSILD
jgi:hypothetical protein